MHVVAIIVGLALLIVILWDTFETIVLPRTVTRSFRLTALFYNGAWKVWSAIARRIRSKSRRETILGDFGPLSLILLLALWAACLVLGFALVQWGLDLPMNAPESHPTLMTHLYMSGVTLFTLGFGDVTPLTPLGRAVTVTEAGVGIGFLALVIGYLPVLYQSFSRREVSISLLDARAGSPPTAVELLRRHGEGQNMAALEQILRDMERWAAELLESHLSYPVLTYYRSQHDRESWLSALTAITDACVLIMVGFEGEPVWQPSLAWQAQLTFAIARHTVVDIALVTNTPPLQQCTERLPAQEMEQVQQLLVTAGLTLRSDPAALEELRMLRDQYEPYVSALADRLFLELPDWYMHTTVADAWQTTAWDQGGHF